MCGAISRILLFSTIDRENRRILVRPVRRVREPLRGRPETEKPNQKPCPFEGIGSLEEALLHDHAAVDSRGLATVAGKVYFACSPPPVTQSERERERAVLERLRADARILASAYRLPLRSVQPERPQVRRRYGICYDDGSIRVRLHHNRTGQLLKYSSLVDTLCHELAHLKHFDHGRRFYAFYEKVLGYARRRGIYRPGPRPQNRREEPRHSLLVGVSARPGPPPEAPRGGPEQLELFPSG